MKSKESLEGTLLTTPEVNEVTACFGEQSFAPISYYSFKVGPFFCKTQVKEGETPEQALARAYEVCVGQARAAYPGARDFHLANYRDSADAVKVRR